MREDAVDVVVVGAGNAALCAAIAARNSSSKVLVLERAPKQLRGGNAMFTAGLVRIAYRGIDEVLDLVGDASDSTAASVDVGEYTPNAFYDDLASVTEFQSDPDLLGVLVDESYPTMQWLRQQGLRFELSLGLHAHKTNGRFRFRGNAPIQIVGGGPGLADFLYRVAADSRIDVWYEARAVALERNGDRVSGVRVRTPEGEKVIHATCVVLACGGFEANPEMRAKYLGPNWDVVKVRGSEFNTGDGIQMALDVGAQPYGHWSGCHATPMDVNAPPIGDRRLLRYERHCFNFGIMVNRLGLRFVDEGEDFETHTYARFGREVLRQPGRLAFQIFDAKTAGLLREEYRARQATRYEADTLELLAERAGIDAEWFPRTVKEFNDAAMEGAFDPGSRDGKRTQGILPAKSNWAVPIDTPPYVAYPVTCGITFTFGGLRIDKSGHVLDADGRVIPGLLAAGELVGGIFHHNYPTGCGITAGAVFGRIAGTTAGAEARSADASVASATP